MATQAEIEAAPQMNDLISRLSAATGPSRELDAEIALANEWLRGNAYDAWYDPQGNITSLPRYTESIDAALTLVPKFEGVDRGIWIKLGQFAGGHGSGRSE